jgi:hypothetical protein
MGTRTPKFLDYLCPRLKDFVTHNFTTKWQDKVELPCLILPFKIFEGPLQVFCMCKLFYKSHLTCKFSVFYRHFGIVLNLHKDFENPKSLLFWSYIGFFYTCFISFANPFSNHIHVLYISFFHSCTSVCALHWNAFVGLFSNPR